MRPTILNLTNAERDVYHKFSSLNLPRHTSYPSVPFWQKTTKDLSFKAELEELYSKNAPISFYVHVPFCEKLCHYCGCNKLIISRTHDDAPQFSDRYFSGIKRELELLRHDRKWNVHQLHFGGGTPTWFSPADFVRLWDLVLENIHLAPEAEVSVELDPRVTTNAHLKVLRDLGVNRVSLGVQDFDEKVQKSIERIQPFEMVEDFTKSCRDLGFSSINFDLIYGLPNQTNTSMRETLEKVIRLSPDRVAFYRLALLPDIYKWQRTFKSEELPTAENTLDFMIMAMQIFDNSHYEFIGLDHFAKSTDPLSIARANGSLKRSFQGMTTESELPVLGIGPSAISSLFRNFRQNEVQFSNWRKGIELSLPTIRSYELNSDDIKCKWVINQLYCYREISKVEFKKEFNLDFDEFFRERIPSLDALSEIGLVEISEKMITLKPILGWLLMRVVAAVLDHWLPVHAWKQGLPSNQASRVG